MSKTAVFNEIKVRLQNGAVVIDDSTFNVKTIRLWNNQILNLDKEAAFAFPAVLVQFSEIDYFGESRRQKKLKGFVTLHIVQKELTKENLDNLDFVDRVARVMEGYISNVITLSMTRTNEVQDVDHGNLIIWEQTYPLEANDLSVTDMIGSQVIAPGDVDLDQTLDPVSESPVFLTGKLDKIFNIQGLAHVYNVNRHGSIDFDGIKIETIRDLNNKGGDLSQTTSGKRPERIQIGDHYAMKFEGAQALKSIASLDKTGTDGVEIFIVMSSPVQSGKVIIESTVNFGSNIDALIVNYNGSSKLNSSLKGEAGTSEASTDQEPDKVFLFNVQLDKSKPVDEVTMFLNGLDATDARTSNSDNSNDFGDNFWYYGARNQASLFVTANLYYVAVFDKMLSEEDRKVVGKALMEEYSIEGVELLPLQP